jgi:hypothetical protein
MHQIRYLLYHALIRAKVVLFGENDAKVEDELIAIVSCRLHANWVAQDTVSIYADLQKVSAELLAGDHEEGDVGEGQVE